MSEIKDEMSTMTDAVHSSVANEDLEGEEVEVFADEHDYLHVALHCPTTTWHDDWMPPTLLFHNPEQYGRWFWICRTRFNVSCPIGSIVVVPQLLKVLDDAKCDKPINIKLVIGIVGEQGELDVRHEMILESSNGEWLNQIYGQVADEIDVIVDEIVNDPAWLARFRYATRRTSSTNDDDFWTPLKRRNNDEQ